MIKGIFHSAKNLANCNRNIERVANNLANLNTTGFKRDSGFIEYLNESGSPQLKKSIDLSMGEVYETKSLLDFAIAGDGLFVVKNEEKNEYTRNGSFQISQEGFLVNQDGSKVMGLNGEINLIDHLVGDNKMIAVTGEGEVKVGEIVVDKLLIVKMNQEDYGKRKEGVNFDVHSNGAEILEDGQYKILQGYLEQSNVNPVREMENMIRVSKDYEASIKMVTSLDESLQKAIELGRI